MINRTLDDPFRIMEEIGKLIDRAMLQIVNVMRHKDLQTADKDTIRQVDQLTRALEYLCDVEEYNRKIMKKIRGMLKTNRWQKGIIRDIRNDPASFPIRTDVDLRFLFDSNWETTYLPSEVQSSASKVRNEK